MQNGSQAVGVNGLGDVVVCAHPHGLHSTVDRTLRRNHDYGHGVLVVGKPLQQFHAPHTRHLEVGDDDGRRPVNGFFQAFHPVGRSLHPVAPGGEQFGQPAAFVFLVLDDQHFFLAHSETSIIPVPPAPSQAAAPRAKILSSRTYLPVCNF